MIDPAPRMIAGDSRRDARKVLRLYAVRPLGAVARFVLALGGAGLLAWLAQVDGLAAAPSRMLFILILAAVLWLFEIIPAYAVGILVIALQILLLGDPRGEVFAVEADDWETFVVVLGHPLIWLFFGGFVLSAAASRTGLDLSLARRLIQQTEGSPARLLFGTMAGSLALSMFMSNTATTAMILATCQAKRSGFSPGWATACRRRWCCLQFAGCTSTCAIHLGVEHCCCRNSDTAKTGKLRRAGSVRWQSSPSLRP